MKKQGIMLPPEEQISPALDPELKEIYELTCRIQKDDYEETQWDGDNANSQNKEMSKSMNDMNENIIKEIKIIEKNK